MLARLRACLGQPPPLQQQQQQQQLEQQKGWLSFVFVCVCVRFALPPNRGGLGIGKKGSSQRRRYTHRNKRSGANEEAISFRRAVSFRVGRSPRATALARPQNPHPRQRATPYAFSSPIDAISGARQSNGQLKGRRGGGGQGERTKEGRAGGPIFQGAVFDFKRCLKSIRTRNGLNEEWGEPRGAEPREARQANERTNLCARSHSTIFSFTLCTFAT